MLKRLKNKYFILALSSIIYQILVKYDIAPEIHTFQSFIDIVTYILMGAGVYTSFDDKEGDK